MPAIMKEVNLHQHHYHDHRWWRLKFQRERERERESERVRDGQKKFPCGPLISIYRDIIVKLQNKNISLKSVLLISTVSTDAFHSSIYSNLCPPCYHVHINRVASAFCI